jgi:hypothetical protein
MKKKDRDWQAAIEWADRTPHDLCRGDLNNVIRDLLKAVHILGERNDELESRVKALESAPTRPLTAYERVLGG